MTLMTAKTGVAAVAAAPSPAASLSADSLKFLQDFLYRRSAMIIEPGKEYLLEARLGPVAKQEGLDGLDALVKKLRAAVDSPLHTRVVDAMTINETSFFRDVHPFETLRQDIIPTLIKSRASTRTIRIWCAAASTGQEPYSIALTIREHFPELATWNVSILATDINQTVLDRAKSGTFKQLEVNRGLPAPMLVKHFERAGVDWRLKESVRDLVTFQKMNLLDRWPIMSGVDVVFIRNVLIYFDVATKRDILKRIRTQLLKSDGLLILGGAETTMNIDDGFESVRVKNTLYYRIRGEAQQEKKVVHAAR